MFRGRSLIFLLLGRAFPGYSPVPLVLGLTFGIRAYLRLNSMGGSVGDVAPEIQYLWIQAAAYFGAACLVYSHQLRISRQHAVERLEYLRKKRQVRQQLGERNAQS